MTGRRMRVSSEAEAPGKGVMADTQVQKCEEVGGVGRSARWQQNLREAHGRVEKGRGRWRSGTGEKRGWRWAEEWHVGAGESGCAQTRRRRWQREREKEVPESVSVPGEHSVAARRVILLQRSAEERAKCKRKENDPPALASMAGGAEKDHLEARKAQGKKRRSGPNEGKQWYKKDTKGRR